MYMALRYISTTNRNKWHFSNNSSENVIANAAFYTWCTQVTQWIQQQQQHSNGKVVRKKRNKWNKFDGSTYELHRLNNLSSVDRADICFSNEQTLPEWNHINLRWKNHDDGDGWLIRLRRAFVRCQIMLRMEMNECDILNWIETV